MPLNPFVRLHPVLKICLPNLARLTITASHTFVVVQLHSVLVIGAHPDDTVLGMGGTIAYLSASGYKISLLSITSGELAGDAELRESEEAAAGRALGASVSFGRLMDGNVSRRDAIAVIAESLRVVEPDMVFVHDAHDTHQDHVNVSLAAVAACKYVPALFFYEGPSSVGFEPNSIVNVTKYWPNKLEALSRYSSQMQTRKLMFWVESVAQFRAWPRQVGAHCEGFRTAHSELIFRHSGDHAELSFPRMFSTIPD